MNVALLQSTDSVQPIVFLGFAQALLYVLCHVFQASALRRIDFQKSVRNAGMFVHARAGVWVVARANG